MTSVTAASTRGRPRSEDRTQAILDATLELLHESGYDNLRMQDVADHACVGLATIYRRWPGKQDLVADAMACKPAPDVPVTGDPDVDLRAMLVWMATDIGAKGEYIAGLMVAAQEHDVIGDAIRTSVRDSMRATLGALLEAKLGPRPAMDIVVDSIPGVLMFRVGLLGERVDPEEFADEAMTLVDSFSG